MKRISIIGSILLAIIFIAGCAKEKAIEANKYEVSYLNAWASKYHPEAQKLDCGIRLLPDGTIQGSGDKAKDKAFVLVRYTSVDLDGNVLSTNDMDMAKQVGSYVETDYYGPVVMHRRSQMAGIEMMLNQMNIPSSEKDRSVCKAIVPGWLMTTGRFDTEQEYINEITGEQHSIYTIELFGGFDNLKKYQVGTIEDYIDNPENSLPSAIKDTSKTGFGFYYMTEGINSIESKDTTKFSKDTTILINYTGRRLDGQVFDTTIEKIAKDHKIYKSSRKYEPMKVTWSEKHNGIKLGTSTVVPGFSKTLWELQYRVETLDKNNLPRKAIGIFTSDYGYGKSGSGNTIPAYSPLIFEIEIIKEEK